MPPNRQADMTFCPKCATHLVTRSIAGRDRLACPSPSCDYVHWDNPIPVVAAIVEIDGKVALTRAKDWPEKWRGLVAGFLEKGETPEVGVLREVREELGLDGQIVAFLGMYSFLEMNQLILAFHVQAEGTVTPGDELESVRLVSPEEIRPWPLGTGPALKDWLRSRGILPRD